MWLTNNKQYIGKCWYHNSQIQNSKGQTVFDISLENNIVPPKHFCKDPNYQDNDGNTQAMKLLKNNIEIPEYLYHDSTIKNNNGKTVAMILAEKDIIPPSQWHHDSVIQNNEGNTVAMILVQHNQDIPECWQHKPEIQDNDGYTVALLYASKGLVPPKEWEHNKYFGVYIGHTFYRVQYFLQKKNINVPEQWKYEENTERQQTEAMKQAQQGKIPDQQYYHDPKIQNINGWTVAMILAENGIIPPKEWIHNKYLECCYQDSVFWGNGSMHYQTVQDILQSRNIKVPPEWQI